MALAKILAGSKITKKDVLLYSQFQRSPLLFIKHMWGLYPQAKGSRFIEGKHITWQQYEMLKAVEAGLSHNASRRISISAGRGIGKAQPKSLVIDTQNGKRRFGDLEVGDTVFSLDGTPTEVVAVHERGLLPVYRVGFDDGSSTLACGDHLWRVQRTAHHKQFPWETKSTAELIGTEVKRKNRKGHNVRKWRIPLYQPVQFPYRWVPVDPYTLGAWLGDGCRNTALITNIDTEVSERITAAGYRLGTSRKNNPRKSKAFWVSDITFGLKQLGLFETYSHQRFIPESYRINSIEIRAEVLRGLLDTDGYVTSWGTIQFTTTSPKLAEDVTWVSRSLGAKVRRWVAKQSGYRRRGGERVNCRIAYTLCITFQDGFQPFYIQRKLSRVRRVSQKRYIERWIDAVEFVGEEESRCITVAAEDGLYLTNDFIVTHNSSCLAWLVLWYLFCFKDAQIGATAPDAQQMYDVLWKECAKWIRNMPDWAQIHYQWTSDHIRMRERPETWFARAKTAKKESPDALAGLHGEYVMVVADEASGIDEEIFNIAEGSLTGDHWLFLIVSNYRRLWGYFHDTQTRGRSAWQTLTFDSRESPIVEKDFLEDKLRKSMGNEDDDDYRVEVRGLPPRSDEMDKEGWVPLLTEEDLYRSFTSGLPFTGVVRLGVDPSGEGDNITAWVARDRYVARVVGSEPISDEKSVAQKTLTLVDHLGVNYDNVTIDNFGSGANVAREIALSGFHGFPRVNSVNVGYEPDDPERYSNLRAEAALRLREWILGGGKLVQDERWKEILAIRYRRNRTGKIEVIPKVKLRERGFPSPNFFDALLLTFVRRGEEFAPTSSVKQAYRPTWVGYKKL